MILHTNEVVTWKTGNNKKWRGSNLIAWIVTTIYNNNKYALGKKERLLFFSTGVWAQIFRRPTYQWAICSPILCHCLSFFGIINFEIKNIFESKPKFGSKKDNLIVYPIGINLISAFLNYQKIIERKKKEKTEVCKIIVSSISLGL